MTDGGSKYKMAVVGDGAVGKSSLTIQLVMKKFVTSYDPTIEDSYRKQATVDDETCILDILDTAGQEDYSTALGDSYIRLGEGFIVVYAVNSTSSFANVRKRIERILVIREGESVPIVLVGNKADLEEERKVFRSEGEQLANEFNIPFLEASAKTAMNVEETFFTLVREIRKWREICRNEANERDAQAAAAAAAAASASASTVVTETPEKKRKNKKKKLCVIL